MTTLQKLVGLCMAIALQACVSAPKYTPMTQEKEAQIQSSTIYVFAQQDEIRPAVSLMNATGALGGGLIAAAIDSANNDDIAASAMDITLPLYKEIVDFDYRKVLMAELNPVFADKFKAGSLPESASTSYTNEKLMMAEVKKLKPGEAHIFSNVFYQFADNSKHLQSTVAVFMFLPNAKPSMSKPDYYNVFHYQSAPVGNGGADSINKWAENGGALFRESMEESAEIIANTLKYDLQIALQESCIKGTQAHLWNSLGGFKVKGKVIEQSGERATVRLADDALMSTSTSLITDATVKECTTKQ